MNLRCHVALFYVSVGLVGVSTILHVMTDRPESYLDYLTNVALCITALFLTAMTVLFFRPQIRNTAKSMELMQAAMGQLQLLETVIQGANDGIIITKAELNNPGPEIIYVNEAFTRISGYSAEEAIGRSPRFLHSEFTKRETLDALRQSLESGTPFKGELLNKHKNGQNYWLEISIVPIRNTQGTITHFAAIEHDISLRKQEEMEYKNMWVQLKRANMKAEAATRDLQESLKKAEEASRAKSDFLANMSHELRTPMNGVLGMAQLLADTRLEREQRDYVSTINSSGESLLMLLNDILDFSKIEAGALVLEHIAYDFKDVVGKVTQMLAPNAHRKDIELLVDIDETLAAYLMGDAGRIRQIITNLVGNAIKFTGSGYVRFSARPQHDGKETFLQVRVEDTGIGIPASKLSDIFEKFTQADASVTRKYGGTGLGLAITKQLITMMGGKIGVESVEGKGSTFWFNVPYVAATACDVTFTPHTGCEHSKNLKKRIAVAEAKVLLVEDYPVNQIFAQKLLNKFGFTQIELAENGAEALHKYRLKGYDVIFMDCQMPEMDGYQTTSKIREIESDTPLHTPIIAMTANAMMGDREKCLKAGMDDYMSKPLRAEHLRAILQGLFILEGAPGSPSSTPALPPLRPAPISDEDNSPAVDMEQLRVFTNGDIREEKALGELFIDQANEILTLLKHTLDDDRAQDWKSAAHRFKGASGNLGAMRLHALCKDAEHHYTANPAQKAEMLTALIAEAKRVEQFFAQVA